MSSSWWDFAEWSGHHGDKLALYNITCPFCFERGNFELAHHLQRKKPSGEKILNYDIYKCGACGNYTMVFWTASSGPGSGRIQEALLMGRLTGDPHVIDTIAVE